MESGAPFDLNAAVAGWRRSMRRARDIRPTEIDELEAHLRDRVEALADVGVPMSEAFRTAVAELGGADELEPEFRRERFAATVRGRSARVAGDLFPPLLVNYARAGLRNMRRSMTHSVISVLGMAVALACCIWILIYIRDETGYDAFHEHRDRIVRLIKGPSSNTPGLWAPELPDNFPAVERAVRVMGGFERTAFVLNDESTPEPGGLWADDGFLDVFSWTLAEGDPDRALVAPYSVVLSRRLADKYFPDSDPIGSRISIAGVSNMNRPAEFTVTGVLAPEPRPSHMSFEYLVSMETVTTLDSRGEWGTPFSWTNRFVKTYLLLRPDTRTDLLLASVADFLKGRIADERYSVDDLAVEPVRSIHLYPATRNDFGPGGNIRYIFLLGGLALFVLVIAIVNFVNLATARSLQRAREVSMRKAVGARRAQIVRQYLVESLLTVGLAVVAALAAARLMQPYVAEILQKDVALFARLDAVFVGGLIAIWLATGLAAGAWPAHMLAGYQPSGLMRAVAPTGGSLSALRRSLVIFQFASSAALITVTIIMNMQMNYVDQRDPGFDPNDVIVIDTGPSENMRPLSGAVAERLRNSPAVVSAAASHSIPSGFLNGFSYIPEGLSEDDRVPLGNVAVDFGFLEMLGVDVAAGRLFDATLAGDSTTFVLNEAAVAELGWPSPEDALGRRIEWPMGDLGFSGTVIGVIRDFNFGSLRDEIPPIVFNISRFGHNHLVFRSQPGRRAESVELVRDTWIQVETNIPFEYATLEEMISAQYDTEKRLTRLFTWTALIALLISCLGLFSLASYATQRRTREIGIRKTLGATNRGIVLLVSRQFLLDVLIAVAIASPVAWVVMNRWLESFAFRTDIGPVPFLLAGLIAAGIAAAAVSTQAFRAAAADPVRSLRTD